MTNLKSTKKALMLSVLSLLLCFTMLIGTTFAWFTDSVSSANNIIKSGNLDITLEYWDGDDWADVEGSSEIFDKDALWEPGYTKVVYLKLQNVGSLALKYQLNVNIVYELSGTNVAGETFKLSDYIHYDVTDMAATSQAEFEAEMFADRTEAMMGTDASTDPLISTNYVKTTELLAESAPVYIAMVVYMPTTVGNVANHKTGTPASVIELGVNLFATQHTYEEDSYNDQYDADAFVPQSSAPKAEVNVTNGKWIETSTHGTIWMNTGLQFEPGHTYEESLENPYGLWHADFVVSADKDIPASSVILPGYYAAYCDDYNNGAWIGLDSTDVIPAGTEIRLIRVLSEALGGDITVNYQDICKFGNDGTGFLCGVAAVDVNQDGTYEAAGATITVELRLYEVPAQGECGEGGGCKHPYSDCEIGADNYVTVGTYSYTIPTDVEATNP